MLEKRKCYCENCKRKYTYSTVLYLSKKVHASRLMQLKPVLFKGQLYITLVIQKKGKHTFKLDKKIRKNSTVEQKKHVIWNLCNMHIG